ncbi:hypothetical protein BMI90_15055 [Thioclava sp. L04-15]|nr:hypothetical protein BMI90_15055 [Thioclava sp. L04-15]
MCIVNNTRHVKAFSVNGQGRKEVKPTHRGSQSITPGTTNIRLWKQTVLKQFKQVDGWNFDTTGRGGGRVTFFWVTD